MSTDLGGTVLAESQRLRHTVIDRSSVRASRSVERFALISYFVILGAALAGFAGLEPWVIGVSAIALATLSYVEHSRLYQHGQELGLARVINSVVLQSMLNALFATGGAYTMGYVLRLLE